MSREISDEKTLAILFKKSDKKLSDMLDIVQAQIPIAFRKRMDRSLARLQKLERLIAEARAIKLDRAINRKAQQSKYN